MAGPGKPGPAPKGDTKVVSARIPLALITAADTEAKQRGLDRTAILVEALAEKLGLPVSAVQEALPLNPAA
jgi:hypothetical protein